MHKYLASKKAVALLKCLPLRPNAKLRIYEFGTIYFCADNTLSSEAQI